MSDWTPGPWTVVPYGDGYSLTIHSDADNRVCFMATPGSRGSWDRIQADARLIATAPELADALREMVDHFYPPGEAWLAEDGTVLARARAALAKLEAER